MCFFSLKTNLFRAAFPLFALVFLNYSADVRSEPIYLAHAIELEAIVVDDDTILDSGVKPFDVIEEFDFNLLKTENISNSLDGVLGISSTKFGPNSSRPIIRGQDGDRIRFNENGTTVQDWSASSFDHAVPVGTNAIKQIEIIRGPAAIMFGGNAVGGLINFVNNRIPKQDIESLVGTAGAGTNFEQNENTGFFDLSNGDGQGFSWNIGGSAFDKGTTKTPTFTDNGEDPVTGNRIRNTKAETYSFGGGFSIRRGSRLVGFSIDNFQTEYGVPKEVNHTLDLKKTGVSFLLDETLDLGLLQRVRAKVKYTDYEHHELDESVKETTYKRDSMNARVELFTEAENGLNGIIGLEILSSKNPVIAYSEEEDHEEHEEEEEGHEEHASLGPLPSTDNRSIGLFSYQYKRIGDSLFEFGARVDRVNVEAAHIHEIEEFGTAASAGEVHEEDGRSLSFTPASVSLGITQDMPGTGVKVHGSASYVERAPSNFELFTGGVHHTTGLYEQGNVNLKKETGKHYDLGLSFEQNGLKVRGNIFYSDYKNYITLIKGNSIFYAEEHGHHEEEEHEGEEEHGEESEIEALEIYDFAGVNSDFKGFEFSMSKKMNLTNFVVIPTLSYDQVIGKRKGSADYLPRLTPKRISLFATISGDSWFVRPEFRYIYSGTRGIGETVKTKGYKLFNVYSEYQLENDWIVFLRGNNLTNELAFSATTVEAVRYFAPLPGRSAMLGIKKYF